MMREEGDKVEVKLTEIDAKSGKLRLSRKVLLPKPERNKVEYTAACYKAYVRVELSDKMHERFLCVCFIMKKKKS